MKKKDLPNESIVDDLLLLSFFLRTEITGIFTVFSIFIFRLFTL